MRLLLALCLLLVSVLNVKLVLKFVLLRFITILPSIVNLLWVLMLVLIGFFTLALIVMLALICVFGFGFDLRLLF